MHYFAVPTLYPKQYPKHVISLKIILQATIFDIQSNRKIRKKL